MRNESVCFGVKAAPGQFSLTGLLIVQGFSLCFILSHVSPVYMCFADKRRKMNWQTLFQTRQESTIWTTWKLDCFTGWSQHWCSKLSDHVIVLGSGTQHWKEKESKADLREHKKLKGKWKPLSEKANCLWVIVSPLKGRNHWINYSRCRTLTNRYLHKMLSYFLLYDSLL